MNERFIGNMSWPEYSKKIKECKGVIIPMGSCEQHGHALPLNTDNYIAQAITKEVAEKANCLIAPSVNFGQVWSAKNFPGTIALTPATINSLLTDIIISLENHGAKNIFFISGHTGNMPVLQEVARNVMDRYGYRNVWYFSGSLDKKIIEEVCESAPVSGKRHAAEGEVSMMLQLYPNLVKLDEMKADTNEAPEESKYRPMRWDEFKDVGCFGDPTAANAEKGKKILEREIDTIANLINKFVK